MRLVIELYNTSGCSLDSQVVDIIEGEDFEKQLDAAMRAFVAQATFAVGDSIKITEVL
jgi:hypothetical protein